MSKSESKSKLVIIFDLFGDGYMRYIWFRHIWYYYIDHLIMWHNEKLDCIPTWVDCRQSINTDSYFTHCNIVKVPMTIPHISPYTMHLCLDHGRYGCQLSTTSRVNFLDTSHEYPTKIPLSRSLFSQHQSPMRP